MLYVVSAKNIDERGIIDTESSREVATHSIDIATQFMERELSNAKVGDALDVTVEVRAR